MPLKRGCHFLEMDDLVYDDRVEQRIAAYRRAVGRGNLASPVHSLAGSRMPVALGHSILLDLDSGR